MSVLLNPTKVRGRLMMLNGIRPLGWGEYSRFNRWEEPPPRTRRGWLRGGQIGGVVESGDEGGEEIESCGGERVEGAAAEFFHDRVHRPFHVSVGCLKGGFDPADVELGIGVVPVAQSEEPLEPDDARQNQLFSQGRTT